MFIYHISLNSLISGTQVTDPWSWVSRRFASPRSCEDKAQTPRKGLGKSGPALHVCGRSVARTQACIFTKDGFPPHRCTSTLLPSRSEGATYTYLERCYATFTPNLECVTNFLVKNLSAVIRTSEAVKKLGTSEQSLKLNQRGHGEE